MGEVVLQASLDSRGVSGRVSSAGLLPGGEPAVPNARQAVAGIGLDLSNHVSRKIDRAIVESADLVLTMERRHVREASVLAPGAFAKTFTLVDFLDRADKRWLAGAPLAERLVGLGADRKPHDVMGTGPDEIEDPIGRSLQVFEQTRDQLMRLSRQLAELLAN